MRTSYFIILLLMYFNMQCFDLQASNRVKIATIGGGWSVVSAGSDRDPQKMVDRVIEYWKREFDKVLIHKPDLILLTEDCDRPGDLNTQEQFDYYRFRNNQVLDYFASVAKENRCYIVFGSYMEENGIWWNSCVVLDREGKVAGTYHKNFPTIWEMEEVRAGTETPLIQCDFGTVGCAICFDLNFDELRERYVALKPDIIVFPSLYHGGLAQSMWAYTCRSFFVGAISPLNSPSEIRNPLGEVVASSTDHYNYAVATVNLDRKMAHLDFNWGKLTDLKKKYGDKVIIAEPGKLGSVLITSEHDRVSAEEMIKEFNIELLDDYFNRVRQIRSQQLK